MTKDLSSLYQCPLPAVTNYSEFSSSKKHKFIILQFKRSEVQKRSYRAHTGVAELCSFQRLKRRMSPCVSTVQRPPACLGLRAPASKCIPPISDFLLLTLWPSSFIKKDPCDWIGSTRLIQDNLSHLKMVNLITSAKSPWPCKIPYPLVLGIRRGHGVGRRGWQCSSVYHTLLGILGWSSQSGECVSARGFSPYQSLQTIFVYYYPFPLPRFLVSDSLLFHLSLSLEIHS